MEKDIQTLRRISTNGREIILLGTAHVSQESIADVERTIKEAQPDCVCVELDETRYKALMNKQAWQEIDIIKILKEKKGFLLLANLVLASFQKKLGAGLGTKPGDEMKAAVNLAESLNIKTEMVDRPIHTTLKRAWAKSSVSGKSKILASLLSSSFSNEQLSAEEIEQLKKKNEMDNMMQELSEYMPSVKTVLIDERDRYLASKIWDANGKKILAVLGAGHLNGTEKFIKELEAGTKTSDVSDIDSVPPKSYAKKAAAWFIPVLIAGLIIGGFFKGGTSKTGSMLISYVLWNGGLAAIGTVIALGSPLAVLVGFLGAPITTMNPFIGVGVLTGIVQAFIKKPRVADMENLQADAASLKGWYKNRIIHALLVFVLSSIGSSIGTFITVPALIASLTG